MTEKRQPLTDAVDLGGPDRLLDSCVDLGLVQRVRRGYSKEQVLGRVDGVRLGHCGRDASRFEPDRRVIP